MKKKGPDLRERKRKPSGARSARWPNNLNGREEAGKPFEPAKRVVIIPQQKKIYYRLERKRLHILRKEPLARKKNSELERFRRRGLALYGKKGRLEN